MNIALALAIASMAFSLVAGILIYRLNQSAIRNAARFEYNKLRLEIDKMLIEKPELWGVYDHHVIRKDSNSENVQTRAQREAFIAYHINLFDSVYDFYTRQISAGKHDKVLWKNWQQYMEQFFAGSSEAREAIKRCYHRYDRKQSNFYKSMILKVENE